jgi:hypothetical protein
MDLYHVWCDLKPGVSDRLFSDRVGAYLGHLQSDGLIHGWRLTRRKLGLGPVEIGEFHIQIDVENLTQLDGAFYRVAGAAGAGGGLSSLRQLTGQQCEIRAVSRFSGYGALLR